MGAFPPVQWIAGVIPCPGPAGCAGPGFFMGGGSMASARADHSALHAPRAIGVFMSQGSAPGHEGARAVALDLLREKAEEDIRLTHQRTDPAPLKHPAPQPCE